MNENIFIVKKPEHAKVINCPFYHDYVNKGDKIVNIAWKYFNHNVYVWHEAITAKYVKLGACEQLFEIQGTFRSKGLNLVIKNIEEFETIISP